MERGGYEDIHVCERSSGSSLKTALCISGSQFTIPQKHLGTYRKRSLKNADSVGQGRSLGICTLRRFANYTEKSRLTSMTFLKEEGDGSGTL